MQRHCLCGRKLPLACHVEWLFTIHSTYYYYYLYASIFHTAASHSLNGNSYTRQTQEWKPLGSS